MTKKLVVLFSGEGSNLQNLIEKLHLKTFGEDRIEIVTAFSNNPDANGIKRCERFGVRCEVRNHKYYDSRESFDQALVNLIQSFTPDLVILSGFMRILSPVFTSQIKAINIHPSLLPLFKGGTAMKDSYESNMKVAGISVHWVNEELDSGEIIAQKCLEKIDGEAFADFKERMHTLEHQLYPEAVLKVLGLEKQIPV